MRLGSERQRDGGFWGGTLCQVWSGLSPAALTLVELTGTQAPLSQPLIAAFPAHFSDVPMKSVLEWVPAAQGGSEAQVGHCATICKLTGLLGALEGGELQTQL